MTWAAFIKTAYKAAREWGVQPSEFWKMSPAEWWAEFDTKSAAQRQMSSHSGSKFSAAEWDRARREYRERANDRTGGA